MTLNGLKSRHFTRALAILLLNRFPNILSIFSRARFIFFRIFPLLPRYFLVLRPVQLFLIFLLIFHDYFFNNYNPWLI